ncbi:MAG TPA: hypothetical protein VF017_15680 [Thermoanaerobaculia bacterium]|nr:hypothetical protein [Thermoanaerobaculia bacterium]
MSWKDIEVSLLLGILLLAPTNVDAQNVTITSSAVGIGTPNPLDKLHVEQGGLRINDAASNVNRGVIITSGGVAAYLSTKGAADTSNALCPPDSVGYLCIRTDYKAITLDANGGNSRAFNLTPSGNVGIGTPAPSARLHVEQGGVRINDPATNANRGVTITSGGVAAYLSTKGSTDTSNGLCPPDSAGYFCIRTDSKTITLDANGGNSRAFNLTPGGNVGIGTPTPSARLHVEGNFVATGSKSAVVRTASYGARQLYSMESPENWFEDFGRAALVNGRAAVAIDEVFAETVNIGEGYLVFLTPKGDCNGLYVAKQTATSFEVRELNGGRRSIGFDYRLVAKRKGYEDVRLQAIAIEDVKGVQTAP